MLPREHPHRLAAARAVRAGTVALRDRLARTATRAVLLVTHSPEALDARWHVVALR